MMHRFLARLPKQPARLRRRLRHRRGSRVVLGSSALFCEFLRAINGEQRGNSGRRAGNGARVQSLRRLGMQARHAPVDAAMPGEAIGYVLRAASAPAQSAAAAASTGLADRILCYLY